MIRHATRGIVGLCVIGAALALGWYVLHDVPPREVVVDRRPCQGHPQVWLSCSKDGSSWERVGPTCSLPELVVLAQNDSRCGVLRMEMDK